MLSMRQKISWAEHGLFTTDMGYSCPLICKSDAVTGLGGQIRCRNLKLCSACTSYDRFCRSGRWFIISRDSPLLERWDPEALLTGLLRLSDVSAGLQAASGLIRGGP